MNGGMSAIGTKRTCRIAPQMSAFGGKADIVGPERQCPLLTQSGHSIFLSLDKHEQLPAINVDDKSID